MKITTSIVADGNRGPSLWGLFWLLLNGAPFFILSSCSSPFWFGRGFAAEVPFRGLFLVFVDVASPRFYFFDAETVQVDVYSAYSV